MTVAALQPGRVNSVCPGPRGLSPCCREGVSVRANQTPGGPRGPGCGIKTDTTWGRLPRGAAHGGSGGRLPGGVFGCLWAGGWAELRRRQPPPWPVLVAAT